MNILVVGHNSLVAKHLFAKLEKCHTLFSAGRGKNADVKIDLLDVADTFYDVPQCDVLIHCAASFSSDTIEGSELNERINALGSFQVSKLAVLAGCDYVINLGTISSFKHPENEYYGTYGISKAHGEENLSHCCRLACIRFISLRLSQIYDDQGAARKHQPFLYQIMDNANEGKEVVLYGTKDPLRNLIHVDDVVQIIERTLHKKTVGIHPVLFPKSYTLSEIASLAFKTFDIESSIHFHKDKPDIKTIHIPAMSDIYEQLGYIPSIDLTVGMLRIREAMYASST
jgi:nucleoside-diphosphate-sugar epimerase